MKIAFFDITNGNGKNLIKIWQAYCVKEELHQYDEVQWENCSLEYPVDYRQYDHFFLQVGSRNQLTPNQRERIDRIILDLCETGKELHIIPYPDDFSCRYIQDVLEQKYDAQIIAEQWLAQIELTTDTDAVILVDCDRTLSDGADSTYLAFDYWGKDTSAFSGIYANGFFSCHQAARASDYIAQAGLFTAECISHVAQSITLNSALIDDLKSLQHVQILPVTAGNAKLWQSIIRQAGINVTVPDTDMIMSETVKYQICRRLQEQGRFVIAIGDSPLDIPMLIRSNRGYVISNKGRRDYMERVLKAYPHIRCLSYCSYQYPGVLSDKGIESITVLEHSVQSDEAAQINRTKSKEGLFGRELREVHRKIGVLLAQRLEKDYGHTDFYVVAIMRSGLSLGLSIADYFDCPVVFCTTPNEAYLRTQLQAAENLAGRMPILVDGVVNTGKTLANSVSLFRDQQPILVTNVLSCGATIPCWGKLYTARLSPKHYADTLSRKGKIDTSDRLFLTLGNCDLK